MRQSIKQFVQICIDTIPLGEPIYEFGSLQVPGQEGFADLRPLFPGRKYVGADLRPGPGVDLRLDLHSIDLPSESAGTVLILDTLEHVEFPREALAEVHRILKPEGAVILSSVMKWPIHDHPHDYWRFTPEAFRSLLKPFADSWVDFAGESDFPHTVVGIGLKSRAFPENPKQEFAGKLEHWKKFWSVPPRLSWKERVKLHAPEPLMAVYRKIRDVFTPERN